MDELFERTIGLLGENCFNKIKNKKVLIFGVGGVGSSAFQALARTGIRNFSIVDFDVVAPSNLNRQILFSYDDIGKNKVDVAKGYIENAVKDVTINVFNCKAQDYSFENDIDFVVDAIDDINGKLYIAKCCEERNIPIIISLGMARRFDPSKVCITTLNKTYNDPFAKKIRYIYKKSGLLLSRMNVVFSSENPTESNGKLNSIITVPSAAGLNIAYFVLKHFLKEE